MSLGHISHFRDSSPAPELVPQTPRVQKDRLPLHTPGHIRTLDGIRGLAVIMVLFCHATLRPFVDPGIEMTNSLDRAILAVARLSWTGVDLFFVLSGFLITGILYDSKGRSHFFRNFYARRTVRIFPLYYAFLVLFLIVWPRLPAHLSEGFGTIQSGTIWYWLYLSNYSQAITEQLGHVTNHVVQVTWSLSIEEQFYLCWPLVVFLFNREQLLKVCVAMFFGSMAIRTGLLAFDKFDWAMNFTICRVDGLAVGAAVALIARGPKGIQSLVRPAWIIGPISAVIVLALIAVMYKMGYRRGVGQSPGYVICGTALFALAFGSLLVIAAASASGTFVNRIFTNPVLLVYGKYSYAVYLLHAPIMAICAFQGYFHPADWKVHGTMLPGLLLFYAITWSLSLLAALVSWNVLEKHCLKLKDYFPMESAKTAA